MATEGRLLESSYSEVPFTTSSDLSPYSTTSSYSGDSSHNASYYGDYEWHPTPDPTRMYYPVAERTDIAMQNFYSGFAAGVTGEVFQPAALWHHQSPEVTSTAQIQTSSILPDFSLSSSPPQTPGSSIMGPNGKPKRKRTQTRSQRTAANIRERKRMTNMNGAFDDLRLRLPAFNYEKRLSRIETLRLAITYIGFMKDVMDGKDPKEVKLQKMQRLDSFQDASSSAARTDTDSE